MGKEWIYLDELRFPKKCPYCGSRRFIVEGARKVFFEATYRITDDNKVETEDAMNEDLDWEVAYGVSCAECGEDLSELAGF